MHQPDRGGAYIGKFGFNMYQTLTLNLLRSSSRIPKIGANACFAKIIEPYP